MNKFVIFFLALSFSLVKAQNNVSEYEYIYVPKSFDGFNENEYQLKDLLIWKLKSLGYKTIEDTPQQWPIEVRQNPCKILTLSVKDAGNMFKNKITLDFIDCNKNKVESFSGDSEYKERNRGYRDAMSKALAKINKANAVEQYSNVAASTVIITKKKVKNEFNDLLPPDKQVKDEETKQIIERKGTTITYTDGEVNLNKIELDNNSFALVQLQHSVPFAIFRPSAKEGVYRVKLENGLNTIGYIEGDKISIEIPIEGGNFSTKVFHLKP